MIAPKKQFGQNFLISQRYIDKIVNSLDAKSGDTLVEIGPGKGALSKKLIDKNFNFVMIEADRDMVEFIENEFADRRNFTIYNDDAAKFDYSKIVGDFFVAGNLPYNVGNLIIKKLLFESPRLKSIVCMLQREVADRICASPKGKEIGFLSIMCRYFADVKKICTVPPGAFFPAPKVHSAVIKLDINTQKTARISRDEWDGFFEFVSLGYSQRRKKLLSVISSEFPSKEFAKNVFVKLNFSENIRAEELSDDDWVNLYLSGKS
ncbi:MAG: 16S rRNA (adenine(1518)-N(6)/adenine(1519)-N(6))-dimethyltransferase RsmA [Chitinispirillales bacterium]|jgi:16S rRNA (adenine1518-N6/adenine1519-N6)-dimethyltransferase|nr:16S rRNA (adenine(1518)-N(6)/adenine(1519)-N(6))-dimethyltransferase RsmA [Chitinispirillales bacterium]